MSDSTFVEDTLDLISKHPTLDGDPLVRKAIEAAVNMLRANRQRERAHALLAYAHTGLCIVQILLSRMPELSEDTSRRVTFYLEEIDWRLAGARDALSPTPTDPPETPPTGAIQ